MKKIIKNDEGQVVPEKCDKCGGEVTLQIHGEPVYLCKKCGKYFGTMPCNLKENKSMKKEKILAKIGLRLNKVGLKLLPDFSTEQYFVADNDGRYAALDEKDYKTLCNWYGEEDVVMMTPEQKAVYNSIENMLDNVNLYESKNMKKNTVKINENTLRKIVAENIKLVIREWAEPDSGEFYPGKYIYYPEDGKIVGDMSYEINDIAELAENTPEGVVNGIKEYFEDDYANWEDERDPNAPVVLYVMSANGSVIGNTYYISSLDAEYAGEIQAKLGAGAKVVSVNSANNISESKTKKNMKKNTVKINENALRQIVAESVKKVLKEWNPSDPEDAALDAAVMGSDSPGSAAKIWADNYQQTNGQQSGGNSITEKDAKNSSKVKVDENILRQIAAESVKRVLNEADNNADYDGNYEEFIRDEMHRLYDLSLKVPKCYEKEIYSMVNTMQGILGDIQRNRDYDNWNY